MRLFLAALTLSFFALASGVAPARMRPVDPVATVPSTYAEAAAPPATRGAPAPLDPPFTAQVVRVVDGDSVTVLVDRRTISVRLAQIDAPERGQPWGRNAREVLAGLVAGRTVRVRPSDVDRYGRMVALIDADGLPVNREMVRRGAAWAYRAYLPESGMLVVEAQARQARRGLWALPPGERVAPWEHRRAERTARAQTAVAR
jgi:endonuclease YncB( thermonuclease family)